MAYEQQLGMEQIPAKKPLQKMYKYKVTAHYSSDRNILAQIILKADPNAIIKFGDSWHLKVKTKMNYSELFTLLVCAESLHYERPRMANLRKIWLF